MSEHGDPPSGWEAMENRLMAKMEQMMVNMMTTMRTQGNPNRTPNTPVQSDPPYPPGFFLHQPTPPTLAADGEDQVVIDSTPARQTQQSQQDKTWEDKFYRLEHTIRNLKGVEDQIIDTEGLCFFPHATLPDRFKWKTEKFDGRGDPRTHLRSFIGQLKSRGFTDEQLGQAFQFSLTGAAHRWLMALDPSVIRTWEDMMKAFSRQYSYNTEVELTRRELETTKQLPDEGFTSYLKRFRDKAAQMWDRPSQREQVSMLMKGLRHPYRTYIFGQGITTIDSLIVAGKQVEDPIHEENLPQDGRYQTGSYEASSSRRPPRPRNKEVNTMMVAALPPLPLPEPTLSTVPYQLEQAVHPAPPPAPRPSKRKFTDLGMPLEVVFEKLLRAGLIEKSGPQPIPNPPPKMKGHATNNCYNLRHAIQDRLDSKVFELRPKQPNVKTNPLPSHDSINMLQGECMETDPTSLIQPMPADDNGKSSDSEAEFNEDDTWSFNSGPPYYTPSTPPGEYIWVDTDELNISESAPIPGPTSSESTTESDSDPEDIEEWEFYI
ncbi:uncharacterized protein LOC122654011 [Telopea speciosissima]|uniref:uncharacterized protein LOC122654011 n=1 Tax=Telopea speciosissima TaxID=54955 RepID=UPI001CC799BB|nr:uncharacterized protein LOC122654011 [Telopea speciosissima]